MKEAFVDAMRRGNVSEESIKAIRRELGIPTELDVNATPEARAKMLTARYTPLTRTQTRNLLDRYAEGGRGFGPNAGAGITGEDLAKAEHTRKLSGDDKTTRMNVNKAPSGRRRGGAARSPGAQSLQQLHGALLRRALAPRSRRERVA